MSRHFLSRYPFATARVLPDGYFVEASPEFPALLGLTMAQFLRLSYRDFTHEQDLAIDLDLHGALVRGEISKYTIKKRYWNYETERWFWVLLQVGRDNLDPHGAVWALVIPIQGMIPELHTAELHTSVWEALRANEMELHYQPIVNLQTRQTVAYEALIRWGRILPDDWLPKLDSSIFPDVCLWAMGRAVRDRQAWTGRPDIAFAVNVSPVSLSVEGFIDKLLAVPQSLGYGSRLQRHNIWLELTEQDALAPAAAVALEDAYTKGHTLVVDDFGMGHSNFSALIKSRHVGVIKIDKSIIDGLPVQGRLVSMIVGMAAIGGFKTVAEGVETEATAQLVQALGVDMGQGWVFGRPEPLEHWQ